MAVGRTFFHLRLQGGLLAAIVASGCGSGDPSSAPPPGPDTARVAITELGSRTYLGFQGGLYPDGRNEAPGAHSAAGAAAAAQVRPLDAAGRPDPDGRIVLLSVGMSNTTMEFCSGSFPTCAAYSFVGQARSDAAVNHSTLVLVDGARGGQAAPAWTSPSLVQYDSARRRLARAGMTEAQVQIVWLKQADMGPRTSLPDTAADGYVLERELGDIIRALKVRYPNLRQVFLSSRIYAGYATSTLNPEPYAYESGFAVKWLVGAQIAQAGGAVRDARAGDLSYARQPWIAWGPYLWVDGTRGRTDGLSYGPQDFQADGTHPSASARQKVGGMLLEFFKTSPFTRCWFLEGRQCS